MRSLLLKTALPALALLAVTATPAKADFVNTWAYTFTSSFSNVTDDGQIGDINRSLDGKTIDWGRTGGARSSIGSLDSPTTGSIDTNGSAQAADRYFHQNNILPANTRSLTSTTLTVDITLTPTSPAGTQVTPALTRSFNIDFAETPNDGSGGVCADGGAVGSGINGAGCADIFTLDFDFGQFDFTYDGFDYSLFLFEDPNSEGFPQLGTLSDEACSFVGRDSGCFGFLTAEDALTVAEFVISIEGQDVPEPAALGLFGLGLMGLGAARRRRKA